MRVRRATEEEWIEFVSEVEEATFFHTPDWYNIWKIHEGLTIETQIIEFENGKKVLLPLAAKRKYKNLLKCYISSPKGTFGGYLMREKMNTKEMDQLDQHLTTLSCLELRENPYQKNSIERIWNREGFTHAIDLRKGWDLILAAFTNSHSRSVKKGIREGVEVRLAKSEDWISYYKIYEETYNRWSRKPIHKYSWAFFEDIKKLKSKQCKLWIACLEGKPIAGCLCFYHQQHAVYWHGASLKDYFSFRPVHVLKNHLIQNAILNGFHWYDFNPSGGLEGVVKFKQGFGAEQKKSRILNKEPWVWQQLFKVYNRINNK